MNYDLNYIIDKNSWYIVNEDGLITCRLIEDNQVLFLSNLTVNELARKKGLATCLLKDAEHLAKNYKCKAITLQAERNSWMQHWYERCGYTIVDKGYDSEFVLMSKIL